MYIDIPDTLLFVNRREVEYLQNQFTPKPTVCIYQGNGLSEINGTRITVKHTRRYMKCKYCTTEAGREGRLYFSRGEHKSLRVCVFIPDLNIAQVEFISKLLVPQPLLM